METATGVHHCRPATGHAPVTARPRFAGCLAGGGWDLITIENGGTYDMTVGVDTLNISGIIDLLDPSTQGVPPNLIIKDKVTGPLTILTAEGGITGDPMTDINVNFGNLAGLGLTYLLSIAGGTDLQLTLTSTIPEPSTYALLALILLTLGFYVHRTRLNASQIRITRQQIQRS